MVYDIYLPCEIVPFIIKNIHLVSFKINKIFLNGKKIEFFFLCPISNIGSHAFIMSLLSPLIQKSLSFLGGVLFMTFFEAFVLQELVICFFSFPYAQIQVEPFLQVYYAISGIQLPLHHIRRHVMPNFVILTMLSLITWVQLASSAL